MRILSCYVKAFGKLSDFSVDFNDGLNTVMADNGSGKTTLAAFIKAMFYGFESGNKRSIAENERKKYTPWGMKRFGGYIDFCLSSGKSYRIERFFESSDSSFVLYDLKTKMISKDFSENIGVELFGVDREGFERTTYYPQKEVEQKPNTTISAKLTSLTHNTSDLTSFDSASKLLDEKRKELTSLTYGEISKLKESIKSCERKIEQCEAAKLSHDRAKKEKQELDEKIKALNEELNNLLARKEACLKKEGQREINRNFEVMNADIEKCESELGDLIAFFKGVEVNESDIKTLNEKIVNVRTFEKSKLSENENVVKEKEEIEKFFKGRVLSLEELESNLSTNASENGISENEKSKNDVSRLLLVLSIVLAVVGCVLIFVELYFAIAAFVVAATLFFAFMFTYFKSFLKVESQAGSKPNINLIKFLSNYFEEIDDVDECVSVLKTNIMKYNALCMIDSNAQGKEVYESDRDFLSNYFSQFFEDSMDFENNLFTLESKRIAKQNKIKELDEQKQKLKEYSKDKKVEFVESVDFNQIKEQEDELKKNIEEIKYFTASKENLISKEQSVFENYEALVEYKSELEEKLYLLEQMKEEVVSAKAFLEKAKNELNSKYLSKLVSGYNKYCGKLANAVITKPVFDSNLKLSFECEGEVKDFEFFSEGYKDVADVCSRLALVEALYEDEKPMLIFDDPFVNLDDEKLINAKKLLKEVANDYQVIYLVCHSSRK